MPDLSEAPSLTEAQAHVLTYLGDCKAQLYELSATDDGYWSPSGRWRT